MSTGRTDAVVVGAGECGTRAAFALRENGFEGRITLLGAEPGLPYERPPLSKEWAVRTICDERRLSDAEIDHRPGTAAAALDVAGHRVVLAGGETVPYDRLLLATGSRARRLGDALVLRTSADAAALRRRLSPGTRVGVVGGGLIGLEVAASAASLGCAVTVVEAAPRLLGRAVPARVAAVVEARHRAAGTQIFLGAGVEARPGGGGPAGGGRGAGGGSAVLRLTGGRLVEVDVVVAGIGSAPETGLAEAAGLDLADGIVVDEAFRTSAPDVFAAGDCCSYPHPDGRLRTESWRAAQEQGGLAAASMLGVPAPWTSVPSFWSDQFDLTLQVAGRVGAAETEVVRRRPDGVELWFGLTSGRLVAAAAVGPGNSVARDVRLAELLIARGAAPDVADLADAGVELKQLLRAPAVAQGTA